MGMDRSWEQGAARGLTDGPVSPEAPCEDELFRTELEKRHMNASGLVEFHREQLRQALAVRGAAQAALEALSSEANQVQPADQTQLARG